VFSNFEKRKQQINFGKNQDSVVRSFVAETELAFMATAILKGIIIPSV